MGETNMLDSSTKDKDDHSDYDSDDPEIWGPYHWSETGGEQRRAQFTSILFDYLKYYSFKGYRNLNFAGEVLVHFFGLNQSRYQWVVDIAEGERQAEEQYLKEEAQREEYKLERELKVEKAKMKLLEEQNAT